MRTAKSPNCSLLAALFHTLLIPALAFAQTPPAKDAEVQGYTFAELQALHRAYNLATWQVTEDPAQLRFGLLRTAELFPAAVIHREGPVAPLASAPSPPVGQTVLDSRLGKLTLDQFLERSTADAFIVIHRGRIVYERYLHMRPRDPHLYWSVSKSMVGALVGMLEDEGRVDVRQPIETYIPELAATDWRGTSVLDILDMASGMSALEQDDPTGNPYNDASSPYFLFESSLGILPHTPKTVASTYDYVANLKRLKPAGRVREYTSVNTFVLSWLIEKVTAKPYAEVLSDRIWRRIGAEADARIIVAPATGATVSHGGVMSTLRDLARYGLIFTPSRAVVSQEPLISTAYLRKVQTGGRAALLAARTTEYPDKPPYEGDYVATYQWDRVWPDGDFFKGGFQGQGLYVSPGRDLVIAGFSSGQPAPRWSYYRALATSEVFGISCSDSPSEVSELQR